MTITLSGFITYAIALGVAAAIPGPGITALVARDGLRLHGQLLDVDRVGVG